jgi:hypothetical protein
MLIRFRLTLIGMLAIILLASFSVRHLKAAGAEARPNSQDKLPNSVLIELFTSEGCSSCPPADALLERLDRSQPVHGAELIVLSEHVDYWNDIGWRDRFSSHEYSERQSAYADRFGLRSIYTPQMVVDGQIEFVGSDERRAIQAIESETQVEKIPVILSSIRLHGNNMITAHVEAGPQASPTAAKSASILLAIADESDESQVSHGENAGRTLKHVAVLRNLVRVGTIDRTDRFSRDVTIHLSNPNSRNTRVVAIVQETPAGRVWGAGWARLSN